MTLSVVCAGARRVGRVRASPLYMLNHCSAHFFALKATSGALRRKAIHCPVSRKSDVKVAWAIISGRVNCWMRTKNAEHMRQ